MIDLQELRDKFIIDPMCPSGIRALRNNLPIGYKTAKGYWLIMIGKGKRIKAHRLVWLLEYGELPEGKQIDHIDRDKCNNSLSNLRLVDQSLNQLNRSCCKKNKTGLKGITIDKKGIYRVQVSFKHKKLQKRAKSLEEAIKIREDFNIQLRGSLEFLD